MLRVVHPFAGVRSSTCVAAVCIAVFAAIAYAGVARPQEARAGTPLNGGNAALTGSQFQGADGNQDSPLLGDPNRLPITGEPDFNPLISPQLPRVDWQAYAGLAQLKTLPDATGLSDTWFFQGKEQEPDKWTFQTDTVTPGKADVLGAWSYTDDATKDVFLNLAFYRSEAGGTTFYNFELNQLSTTWVNSQGTTVPCRKDGDVIISFNLQGGAGDVGVDLYRWQSTSPGPASCPQGKVGTWTGGAVQATGDNPPLGGAIGPEDVRAYPGGPRATYAQGAMNAVAPINNYLDFNSDGDNNAATNPSPTQFTGLDTFGETSLNLSKLLAALNGGGAGNSCFSFGQLQLHTRSSSPFTADLKDFIAPKSIIARSCSISGVKYNDTNGNGSQDAGEPGIAGVRIYADANGNNSYDAGEPTTLTADGTNAARPVGSWSIEQLSNGTALPAGTYHIREVAPAGSQCTDPATGETGLPATVTVTEPCEFNVVLADGANVAGLKFGNFIPPTIEIRKTLVPAADSGRFDLNVDGGAAEGLTEGDTGTTGPVQVSVGDAHSVAETAAIATPTTDLANYTSTVSCTKNGSPYIASTSATSLSDISVAGGDAVVCTFVNTRVATLTVVKDAVPNHAQDFAFTSTGLGSGFSLDDDADATLADTRTITVAAGGLGFGSKTLAETPQAGWSLTSISCRNGTQPAQTNATIDVQPGDVWVCTFTNEQDATVEIVKEAVPNDAQDFAFATEGSGLSAFSLDDDSDATLNDSRTFTIAAAQFGAKTVSEAQVGNWDLATLACVDGQGAPPAAVAFGVVTSGVFSAGAGGSGFGAGDTAVQVDAQAGTHVVCTFTNKKVGLDVAKLAVNATVSAGDRIGYAVTTTNTGEGTARGVVVTDPLPEGVEWTIKSQTNAGECSISPTGVTTGQVVTCSYGDLVGGAVRELEIEATTTGEACTTYDNTATATATNAPSDTDSAVIRCLAPSISITKTAAASPINAGETAKFTITVANAGPGTAYAVTVKDPLPAGLTWAEDSADCAIAADPQNGNAPTLSCAFGDLAAGAAPAVNLTAQTSFDACATYVNTATVAGTNFASRQAGDTITCRTADLQVVKTPDAQVVDAGEALSFQIVTSNTGEGSAKNAVLDDPLPAGVTWSITGQADGCEITGSTGSQALHCSYGDLPPTATRTVTVTAQTSFDDCATYDNSATVDADNTPPASDDGKITCKTADLDVTKLAVETVVSAGDKLGFTITTRNTGEGSAKGVMLSDPLPAGVSWSIAAQDDDSAPLECAITGAVNSQVLECSYGDLAAGALRTVKVEAQTDDEACTTYDNTATATATNAPSDTDSAVIRCLKPNVTITKSAGASPIDAGDNASFTITVSNQGSSQTTGAATAVKLSDPLTSSLSWTLGGADAPSCTITGSQLDCEFGDLAPGSTRVVTLTAPTTEDECGVHENTATVDGDNFAAKTASATVVCQKPKLMVEKTATATTVDPGDPVTFTITSANTGGEGVGAAKAVTLHDPLPAGVEWSIAGQDDETAPLECEITGGIGSQVLDCAYGDLNPGASRTVTVTATTSFEQCGVYDNTATLAAGNAGDVQDAATITCRPPATVRIRKLVDGQATDATKFGFQSTLTPNAEDRSADFQLSPADGTTAFTVRADGTTYSIRELEPYGAGQRFVSAACVQDDVQPEPRASKNTTTDVQRTATLQPTSGASYTCTFANTRLTGGLLALKSPKTQTVYLDGTASYSYDVSNPGTSDLADVTLTDDRCSAISAPDKSTAVDPDNDGDELLEAGETWRYACTVSAADLFRSSSGPVTNTATATAKDQAGTALTASDTALTTLLAPGIAIDKTGPATAIAGELITYNLAVTNTGNTSFPEAGVKLSDTVVTGGACATTPTIPTSKNADKTPGELNPGETWIYQCQVQTRTGDTRVTNKGDVSGTDGGGKTVTATDTADTVLAAAAGAVSPAGRISGRARLTGTVGCAVARYARASVTGNSIKQVTFYVNGKLAKRLTKANSGRNYQLLFRTKSLKYGTYKVQAKVQFKANTVPRSRTLNLQFSHCRPRVIAPKFTG